MAKRQEPTRGSWLLAEELLDRGDAAFVDELRHIHDADRLGAFAARWHADKRPAARRLMFDYLAQPLNAFRHEPLVKRLFKLAEKAGDDALLARFLVAFDRSVRRQLKKRHRHDWNTRESWTEETVRVPSGMAMPRSTNAQRFRNTATGELMVAPTPQQQTALRLFSVHTRNYLRRRAWRYFRKLGKQQPQRYLPAIVEALQQYTDADMPDGLALLDNWGLVHALFGVCPALVAKPHGWALAEGRTLAELAPAPAFEPLWQASPAPLVELMKGARCRPVRQWAIRMLRRHFPNALATLPLSELLVMLASEDAELSQLAVEALRQSPELGGLRADQWLELLEAANPQTLDVLCELMQQRLSATYVNLQQAVKLACSRPLPVARLGLALLRTKQPVTSDDYRLLLSLAEAEAAPLRPELIGWARSVLGGAAQFQVDWVLELLDSRHADVRAEGWNWFRAEARAAGDVSLWQRLLESPYDDLRLQLVVLLEEHVARSGALVVDHARLDDALVRFLWATVLLNVHRGSRVKPRVVRQLLARLERRPEEADELLPILAVVVRSVRKPEWRAGLAGVLQLIERRPELEPAVQSAFPELELTVSTS
jgi:hypothetical protein